MSSTMPLEERLVTIKKAVRKATEEAMKQASLEQPKRLHQENDDPNASFMLGMDLFGQETSVLERNLQDRLDTLERELQDVQAQLQQADDDAVNKQNDDATTPIDYSSQARHLSRKIAFLRHCSQARSLVEGDWIETAQQLSQAQDALRQAQAILEDEADAPPEAAYQIVDSIQAVLRRARVDLIDRATALVQTSITLTPDGIAVRANDSGGLAAAYRVLKEASDGDSALHSALRTFTQNLFQTVFLPVLNETPNNATPWAFQETENRASAGVSSANHKGGKIHGLEWSRSNNQDGTPVQAWKCTLEWIQRILAFVQDRVLLKQETHCQFLGKLLLGQPNALPETLNLQALGVQSTMLENDNGLLMNLLVDRIAETCVPAHLTANLQLLPSMAEELRTAVEPFLAHIQVFQPAQNSRLADFISNFEQTYVEKRRITILNQARELLLNNDYHNTVPAGNDPEEEKEDLLGADDGMSVFHLQLSAISDTASKLMDLCRKTMDEAVASQNVEEESPLALLSPTLYRTAREMLDLFRAIIPAAHGDEVANVPRTAAVLHNDCVFFAFHCLHLGLEYKEQFQQPAVGNLLRQTCMFVDMVPIFREMADRAMGDMIVHQEHQIMEVVGQRITLLGEALRSDESLVEWSDAETALTAGLYHLRHLQQGWQPVLAPDVYKRSMGHLADVIFTLYLDQVLKASDISETACHFIGPLFQKGTQGILQLMDGDSSGSQVSGKFVAVGQFMFMSLADIQEGLSDGVFRSVTGPELTRLIKATFSDTPKRQSLLKILSSHP